MERYRCASASALNPNSRYLCRFIGLLNPLPRTPRNPHSDPRTDRNHIDAYVPQQDLVDSYLPSFQTCVEEGKVTGVMVRGERARRAFARARPGPLRARRANATAHAILRPRPPRSAHTMPSTACPRAQTTGCLRRCSASRGSSTGTVRVQQPRGVPNHWRRDLDALTGPCAHAPPPLTPPSFRLPAPQ